MLRDLRGAMPKSFFTTETQRGAAATETRIISRKARKARKGKEINFRTWRPWRAWCEKSSFVFFVVKTVFSSLIAQRQHV